MSDEVEQLKAEIAKLKSELDTLRDPARVDAGYDLLDQLYDLTKPKGRG